VPSSAHRQFTSVHRQSLAISIRTDTYLGRYLRPSTDNVCPASYHLSVIEGGCCSDLTVPASALSRMSGWSSSLSVPPHKGPLAKFKMHRRSASNGRQILCPCFCSIDRDKRRSSVLHGGKFPGSYQLIGSAAASSVSHAKLLNRQETFFCASVGARLVCPRTS
jgi:hypothetical protein